jgi:hypothetical protein
MTPKEADDIIEYTLKLLRQRADEIRRTIETGPEGIEVHLQPQLDKINTYIKRFKKLISNKE